MDISKGFNPRPRAGGDTHTVASQLFTASFNPRPRAGGDGSYSTVILNLTGFNPRPRAGGDTELVAMLPSGKTFQSTPPRGGRLSAPKHMLTKVLNELFRECPHSLLLHIRLSKI
ncbi:hypothetical protein SBDP2_380014 [Syntrophobacter sp. SbD2]|nr:hypothetical protein SBDP2_380014 [Syntrophobacter sp. SbD2]